MKRLSILMATALPPVGLATLATLATLACDAPDPGEPIVGRWESSDRIVGERNELIVEEDLDGEAVIFAYLDDTLFAIEFDVVVDREGDGYELDFECDGDCAALDFKMDCELIGDELECDGDDGWSDYDFEWERR